MKQAYWAFFCLALVFGCSQPDRAGGTMETENSVAIQVLDSLGNPSKNATVRIRPLWYLGSQELSAQQVVDSVAFASGVRDLQTDKNGRIRCDALPSGRYRMEVGDSQTGAAIEFEHFDTTSEQSLGRLVLEPTGVLQGSIELPEGAGFAWVRIYGSDVKIQTDAAGRFEFVGVPTGVVRVVASVEGGSSILGEDLAQIRPGRTTRMGTVLPPSVASEDPLTWRYSSLLRVDTLVRDWMLPLSDTAMLTFRLNAPDFDFAEAMGDGRDLRVSDPFENPLRFECVLWDSTRGKAIVRVAVPSSLLDSVAFITLRWGRPGALVPDTTGLWEGVPDSVRQYLTTILVGNFETPTSRTDLPHFLAPSWWYRLTSDSLTTMSPGPDQDIVTAFQPAGPDRAGNAAHFTYKAAPYHWVILGAGLGGGYKDLSSLDSVVFFAKGNGELSLALENLSAHTGFKAWVHVSLDSNWTRYRIRPSDFLPAKPNTEVRNWSDIQDSVSTLSILVGQGDEFWVDDVELYGVGVEDFR